MGNLEHALSAYENALRHNSHSLPGLTQVAGIARIKENYGKVRALSLPSRVSEYPAADRVFCLTSFPHLIPRSISRPPVPRVSRPSNTSRLPFRCRAITAKYGPRWVRHFAAPSTLPSSHTCRVLGHCYLMQDDLQKAYSAYQQALYLLPNPKEDPKLWYGIGILYDRYGSLDHAEEAFASVLAMDKGMCLALPKNAP